MKQHIKFGTQRFAYDDSYDANGDGIIEPTETITRNTPANPFNEAEPSELKESLQMIDSDDFNPTTRMNAIDLRSVIHRRTSVAMSVYETLIATRHLPADLLPFTTKVKRHSVSEGGWGRKERRDIIIGKRQMDATQGGMIDAIKGGLGLTPKA